MGILRGLSRVWWGRKLNAHSGHDLFNLSDRTLERHERLQVHANMGHGHAVHLDAPANAPVKPKRLAGDVGDAVVIARSGKLIDVDYGREGARNPGFAICEARDLLCGNRRLRFYGHDGPLITDRMVAAAAEVIEQRVAGELELPCWPPARRLAERALRAALAQALAEQETA